MKEKLYLCGPITDNPGCEEEFAAAEAALKAAGYIVINPLKLHDREKEWEEYMKRDIKFLLDCDGITLLGDYKNARGCQLEIHIAFELSIKIARVDSWIRLKEKNVYQSADVTA